MTINCREEAGLGCIALSLSPEGHLYLDQDENAQGRNFIPALEKVLPFFDKGCVSGILHLGLLNTSMDLPPDFIFWQQFSTRFITEICKLPEAGQENNAVFPCPTPPSEEELTEFIANVPFMKGLTYLNKDMLLSLWKALHEILLSELHAFQNKLKDYLGAYNTAWNLLGRVCFHLAENKDNEARPFAFLATYTSQLSKGSKVLHLPLKHALQEYAGEKNKAALLALLLPLQKASAQSSFIKALIDSGEIFQALAWNPKEAYSFLKEIPFFESAGIVVKVPNWWNAKRPPRPQIKVSIGQDKQSILGMDTLLNFNMQFTLGDGETLSDQEWRNLLASTDKLVKIKGQWVEVDPEKLQQVLSHWKKVQKETQEGLSFAEGMRLLSGAALHTASENNTIIEAAEWSFIRASEELQQTLNTLRNPAQNKDQQLLSTLKNHLKTVLRPYQEAGVRWLWLLYQIKLGGCLADDMGLGKTIQILSLFLLIKYDQRQADIPPHLLIVPSSLLGNWETEIKRFAPGLKVWILHSSREKNMKECNLKKLSTMDVVITSYSFSHRIAWLNEIRWEVLVLDEAQLIKNPTAKQTRAIKSLKSRVRFSLTGTPIENSLSDLWSLFDFTLPGLLGTSKIFHEQHKKYKNTPQNTGDKNQSHFYASLRRLVSPYILRRLKSDKQVINDLPDKTELQTFCTLSKQQAGLYQQAVLELSQKLQEVEGIQRRGLILSYLLRFKQICNHPVQYLGHGIYSANASGKFLRLQEICEQIAERQEKVLIFTQFKEIIPGINNFLASIFKCEGLVLHGETPVKQRLSLVENFQQERGAPFFILSLKAGGTGLNLTRAAHVVHFDRWWNPSVENQATDRAYRIGQKKNVLVHKFICRGTIEEKIDTLIQAKKTLSQEILSSAQEINLIELGNEELMKVVSLDISRAMEEI